MRKLIINCDGGSRGNPGEAAIGIVMRDENEKIIKEYSEIIGKTTNNVAEYKALIYAMQLSLKIGVDEVIVYMDSELVVRQLNGKYRIRAKNLKILYKEAKELEKNFKSVAYSYVPREDKFQKIADRLVNEALDENPANYIKSR